MKCTFVTSPLATPTNGLLVVSLMGVLEAEEVVSGGALGDGPAQGLCVHFWFCSVQQDTLILYVYRLGGGEARHAQYTVYGIIIWCYIVDLASGSSLSMGLYTVVHV